MNKFLTIILFLINFSVYGAASNSDSAQNIDNSDQVKILYTKAEKYIYEKKFKKSLKLLRALTKREDLGDLRADIYNLLGFSYRKINKPKLDKSFAAYMMALEIDPEHIGAHEYLGELYLMLGQKEKSQDMLLNLEVLAGVKSKEYLDLKFAIENFQD